jgi:UDP-N-acetylmuramyl pentapeptide phosphotransferase/UDP-N-acetylglucosamine-1-phosphate transferase
MFRGYQTYEVVFLGAMLVAILATALVTRLARAMRILDQPGQRKVHASAIPRVGGAAIVFSTFLMVLPILGLDNTIGVAARECQTQLIMILAGGLFMFAVGIVDDIRGLRARTKFIAQLMAAAGVCASGVRIDSFGMGGEYVLHLGWVSWPLTMLWIVGITNAMNLIDGLDGLAAGISTVTCGVIAAFAVYTGQPVMAILMLGILGSLLGFLFLNFNPARIFMGDCGSLFLGFVLASASVQCAEKSATLVGLAVPFLAMGVPIFDTLFSMLRRALERRGLFSPDRGHIHHRLLDGGLRQHQVAILVYFVTLIAAGLGLFMIFVRGEVAFAIFVLVVTLLVLVFRAAGAVRLRETLAKLDHTRAVKHEAYEQRIVFEQAQLGMRAATTFDQWWAATSEAARKLGFARLILRLSSRDGTDRTLVWHRSEDIDASKAVAITLPIRDRRAGSAMQVRLLSTVDGAIESVGRRATYFGRLMDENGPASLLPAVQTSPSPAGVSYELTGPAKDDPDQDEPGKQTRLPFRIAKDA